MSAWDLTCRSLPLKGHVLSGLASEAANSNGATTATAAVHRHCAPSADRHSSRLAPLNNPLNLANQCRLALDNAPQQLAPFVAAAAAAAATANQQPPSQASIWQQLNSSKQLQAILEAARLQAKSSLDLVPPLEWLHGQTNLDLTWPRQPPAPTMMRHLEGSTTGEKLLLMTIPTMTTTADSFHSSSRYNRNNQHQLQPSIPTPVRFMSSSSTSSSRSSSTQSINLSLTATSTTGSTLGARHQAKPTHSPFGSSSDADYPPSCEDASASTVSATGNKVDRRARKKDQNRRAAYNYRRKKIEERDRMVEEEARLVHKHVRLAGKIARLERRISLILNTKTAKIFDRDGQILCYTCPLCSPQQSCESIQTLRAHLKEHHPIRASNGGQRWTRSKLKKCSNLSATTINKNATGVHDDDNDEPTSTGIGMDSCDEYDSCTDSDATDNHGYVELYNDCDAKFVIETGLLGDNNNDIKNNRSF